MPPDDQILLEAKFDKKPIQKYWMLAGIIVSILTVVGIPLMLIWVPIMLSFSSRIIDRMEATLTPTKLIIRKGWLVRIEKVLPLEKITDLGLVQGPIMRALGLHNITVETAGSSGSGQSLVKLIGVIDTDAFRTAVLAQRDAVSAGKGAAAVQIDAASDSPGPDDALERINGTLERIEKLLEKQAERS